MEKLTAFEHYIKSVIEAYGTQPGKPLDLPDDTVKRNVAFGLEDDEIVCRCGLENNSIINYIGEFPAGKIYITNNIYYYY